jgi:hypothetical protein
MLGKPKNGKQHSRTLKTLKNIVVFIRAAFGQYEFRELHFPVYYMEKK